MQFQKIVLSFILMLVFSAFSVNAQDVRLFGTDIREGGQDSSLYEINQQTGIPTFIGDIEFDTCRALEFHPQTNVLYGVCARDGEFGDRLIMIDHTTGQGTEIGPLNNRGAITDISFREDGTLFAYSDVKLGDSLGVIDLQTGNYTELGQTGLLNGAAGIGFSLNNVLYFAGSGVLGDQELFILDQTNGAPSFVNPLSGFTGLPAETRSLDVHPITGVMFAQYFRPNTGDFLLATLDLSTGVLTNIGIEGENIFAIAFMNPVQRNVPTLSEYGLIIASILLFIVALIVIRRRKQSLEI